VGVGVRQKVPGGPWWVFIRHRGRRKCKLVGDKRAALQLAKELRRGLAASDLNLFPDPPATLTFAQYTEQYLPKVEPELKRSTYIDYAGCARRQLVPLLGDRLLPDIRRRDVKDLRRRLRTAGFSETNADKHVRILSAILSEAVEDELIPANPALALGRRRRSKDRAARHKRIVPFTAAELAALLETARTHAITRNHQTLFPFRERYAFLLLLARTGMRLGEAVALQWGDIDWRGGFVLVQRAYVRGELSVTKSGKSRRVDLSAQLQAVLRERFAERFQRVVALDAERQAALEAEAFAAAAAEWIFPGPDGPMDEHAFRRRTFKPLLVAVGLRHMRVHDLRHTYASLLLGAGADLKYVQEQLGHHSAAFTLATYAHLLPSDRHGLVNQLDSLAPNGTPVAPNAETATGEASPARSQVPGIARKK
jgi:integrase